MDKQPQPTLGFIGVGNMGSAIARGAVTRGGFDPSRLALVDVSVERANQLAADLGVRVAPDLETLCQNADVVLVCVKPQGLIDVVRPLAAHLADKLVVSIAAGISLETLAAVLPQSRLVRVMPNTPCLVGEGASGLCSGPTATPADIDCVDRLFASIGLTARIDETAMDALTALSGSGPAYVFHLADAMTRAGVALGLPPVMAEALATQTIVGAGRLLQTSDADAATLRQRVMSPGGTTERAIAAFDAGGQNGLHALVRAAMTAARDRSIVMGEALKA